MKRLFAFVFVLFILAACQPAPPAEPKESAAQPAEAKPEIEVKPEVEPVSMIPEVENVTEPQNVTIAPQNITVVEPMPAGRIIEVIIDNMKFSPEIITIKVGDTIVWKQNDEVSHTVSVSFAPAQFDSGVMRQGETFKYTFKEPGTYLYKCSLHPIMRGKIIVEQ